VNAHRNLGWIYAEGFLGHRDWKKAERHYRAAAEKGDATAQWRLGQLWLSGKAGMLDDAGARRWIQRSAENGNPDAQNFVGMSLEGGSVGAENFVRAIEWYRKAADQGLVKAQSNLARLYLDADGVAKSPRGLHWLRKAAAQDDGFALYVLAWMYLEGSAVQQDIALGDALLRLSQDAQAPPGTEPTHSAIMVPDPPSGCAFPTEMGISFSLYVALIKPGKFEEELDRYLAGPRPCAKGPRRTVAIKAPILKLGSPP
jgi:TPR repeat protein